MHVQVDMDQLPRRERLRAAGEVPRVVPARRDPVV